MPTKKFSATELKSIKSQELWKLGELKLASPLLPIAWSHLGTPQTGNPEYDGEYGMYRFDLVIDPDTDDGKKFIAKFESAHDHMIKLAEQWAKASGTKVKFIEPANLKPETTGKGGDKTETGNLVLKFKKPAKRFDKKKGVTIDTPVLVIDTKGNEVPRRVLDSIGNGTKVQVLFDLKAYCMNGSLGTSVKVIKVRLVDLVKYGNNINDDEYFDEDFGAVEGSYDATADISSDTEDTYDEPDVTEVDEDEDF